MSPSRDRACPVCGASTPSTVLMCRRHWLALSYPVRARLLELSGRAQQRAIAAAAAELASLEAVA